MQRTRRPGLFLVSVLWTAVMLVQLAPPVFGSGPQVGAMTVLFWLVVIAASMYVVIAAASSGSLTRS